MNREGVAAGRAPGEEADGDLPRPGLRAEGSAEQLERGQQAARARVAELPFKRRTLSIAAAGDQHKTSTYLNERNLSLYEGH